MKKVSIWNCHRCGEQELIYWTADKAYCPHCGAEMKKTGEYEE